MSALPQYEEDIQFAVVEASQIVQVMLGLVLLRMMSVGRHRNPLKMLVEEMNLKTKLS